MATKNDTPTPNLVPRQQTPAPAAGGPPPPPPPSKTMLPATLQKVFSNSQRNMTKSSRYRPGLQIPHIQIQLSICGIYMNKSDPRRPHLITHRTQRINCQSPGARHRRTTSEGLCPCPNGSEPRLIYVGT